MKKLKDKEIMQYGIGDSELYIYNSNDVKEAVLELIKVIEDEERNCCDTPISIRLKDRIEEIFGDFEK